MENLESIAMAMTIPGSGWQQLDGWASDIAAGGIGNNLIVYHIGSNKEIYQWNGSYGWRPMYCRGKTIAVGPDGDLWFIGLDTGVFRRDRSTGKILEYGNARGTDISVGRDGTAWLCYYLTGFTYRGIWRWNAITEHWEEIEGYGSRISAGDGDPWHIGEDNSIYKWTLGKWRQIEGWAEDIAVSANGEAWHVGRDNKIYFWALNRWWPVVGEAKRITVGPRGWPWIVMENGTILRRV